MFAGAGPLIYSSEKADPGTENRARQLTRLQDKAIPQSVCLAKSRCGSDRTVVVEGNHYFPPDSIRKEHLVPSETHTICGWKGTASYYTVQVDGQRNPDAASYYAEPKDAARQIAGYVAFWKGRA
jgi:uncharacterized protein (DUF427 family)